MIFMLIFLSACGKTTGPYDEQDLHLEKFTLRETGHYRAPLTQLNQRKSNKVEGRASFFINETQVYAKVTLTTGRADVQHFQMIHTGSECPTMDDDLNGDGYLDALEAMAVAGKVLVPLDEDLSSQLADFTIQPITNEKGKYLYSQATSSKEMLSDLRQRDPYPWDYLAKLGAEEEIGFDRRLVMIYGVPESSRLPQSVAPFPGLPTHISLPIACGKIVETDEVFP